MATPFGVGITTLKKYCNAASIGALANLIAPYSGSQFIRLQINERDVEKPQGTFNFASAGVDAIFQELSAYPNLKVILPLQDFATWYLDGNGLPTYQGMQAWGQALINQYGTQIHNLEMGNEEFSFVSGSARDASNYYNVISNCYTFLKALQPGLRVGMYGYTNYCGCTGKDGDPAFWFNALGALGGFSFMDYIQVHWYHNMFSPDANNPGGSPPFLSVVNSLNTAQNAYGFNLPISIGEFGWQAQTYSGCQNLVSPATQTAYTETVYNEALSAANVNKVCLYTCGAALGPGGNDCHDVYGLSTYGALQSFFSTFGSNPPPPPPPGVPPSQTGYGGDISQGSPIGASSGGYVFHNERVRQMFVGPGARGRNGRHVKTWKDLLPWN